mmetsp:Transcript_32203/g.102435  ORF Transcript_32203/g.102435 Transcript_32203/m.102435 type:complete len:1151 (-) Transcript_32203:159-3611(-)
MEGKIPEEGPLGDGAENAKGVFSLTEAPIEEAAPPERGVGDESDKIFISEIMMLLNTDRMSTLKAEFELKGDEGLTLAEFVSVMKQALDIAANAKDFASEDQLIVNLCELFAQIDVNGDGTMEWEEFTSFILESNMASYGNEPDTVHDYIFSSTVKLADVGRSGAVISKAYYFPENDRVAIVEDRSTFFRTYDSKLKATGVYKRRVAVINCIEYIPSIRMYAVASSDTAVSMFNEHNAQLNRSFRVTNCPTTMVWIHSQQLLCLGSANGEISLWDVEDMEERHYIVDGAAPDVDDVHSDAVLALEELHGLEMIASGSMDKTIRLWDAHTGRHKKALHGHKKGVSCLAYSQDYRLLMSGSFDYDICIWNPYIQHLIMRLHGHVASICGIIVVPYTPQLVTADRSGVFKIWDVRNFGNVQTFAIDEGNDVEQLCILNFTKRRQIVGVAKHIHVFEYREQENPLIADDEPTFATCFNPVSLTIATCSSRHIKIWCAQTGALLRVYRGLNTVSELTSLCLDFRLRKIIVGDHSGTLTVYNYSNGAKMKEFCYEEAKDAAHEAEVTSVKYCDRHQTVISGSWDGSVKVHDEMDRDGGILLRQMTGAHLGDICGVAYSEHLSLIASACTAGVLQLWDYEFGRPEQFVLHPDPIACIDFLDPYPLIMCADTGGRICIWATRPSRLRGKLVYQLRHQAFAASKVAGEGDAAKRDAEGAESARRLPTVTTFRVMHHRDDSDTSSVSTMSSGKSTGEERTFDGLRQYFRLKEAWRNKPSLQDQTIADFQTSKRGRTGHQDSFLAEARAKVVVVGNDEGLIQVLDFSNVLKRMEEYEFQWNNQRQTMANVFAGMEKQETGEKASPRRSNRRAAHVAPFMSRKTIKEAKAAGGKRFLKRKAEYPFRPQTRAVECVNPRRSLRSHVTDRLKELHQRYGSHEVAEPKVPRRHEKADTKHSPREAATKMPKFELEMTSMLEDLTHPEVLAQWQAHSDAVLGIECVQDPEAIITCSADKHVKIWTMSGELLGTLCQGGSGVKSWGLEINLDAVRRRRLRQVQSVSQSIRMLNLDAKDAKDAEPNQGNVSRGPPIAISVASSRTSLNANGDKHQDDQEQGDLSKDTVEILNMSNHIRPQDAAGAAAHRKRARKKPVNAYNVGRRARK